MSSTSTQVRGRSRSLSPWSWVLSRTPFCAPGLFLSLNSCARSWAVAGLSLPLREGQGGEFSWISCPCSPPSFLALPRSYSKASSSHLVFCFQATPLAVCPPPPVPSQSSSGFLQGSRSHPGLSLKLALRRTGMWPAVSILRPAPGRASALGVGSGGWGGGGLQASCSSCWWWTPCPLWRA